MFVTKPQNQTKQQKQLDRTHEPECDCAFQDDAEYPNIGSK